MFFVFSTSIVSFVCCQTQDFKEMEESFVTSHKLKQRLLQNPVKSINRNKLGVSGSEFHLHSCLLFLAYSALLYSNYKCK